MTTAFTCTPAAQNTQAHHAHARAALPRKHTRPHFDTTPLRDEPQGTITREILFSAPQKYLIFFSGLSTKFPVPTQRHTPHSHPEDSATDIVEHIKTWTPATVSLGNERMQNVCGETNVTACGMRIEPWPKSERLRMDSAGDITPTRLLSTTADDRGALTNALLEVRCWQPNGDVGRHLFFAVTALRSPTFKTRSKHVFKLSMLRVTLRVWPSRKPALASIVVPSFSRRSPKRCAAKTAKAFSHDCRRFRRSWRRCTALPRIGLSTFGRTLGRTTAAQTSHLSTWKTVNSRNSSVTISSPSKEGESTHNLIFYFSHTTTYWLSTTRCSVGAGSMICRFSPTPKNG